MEDVNRLEENKDSTEFDASIRIMENKNVLKLNLVEKQTDPCVKLVSK